MREGGEDRRGEEAGRRGGAKRRGEKEEKYLDSGSLGVELRLERIQRSPLRAQVSSQRRTSLSPHGGKEDPLPGHQSSWPVPARPQTEQPGSVNVSSGDSKANRHFTAGDHTTSLGAQRLVQKMEWLTWPPPLNLMAPCEIVEGEDGEREGE